MSQIRIPSIGHGDKYGYLLDSDFSHRWERRSGPSLIHPQCTFYETYGDGNVQHSPEIPIPVSMFADWCASMAVFVMDERNRDALEILGKLWPRPISWQRIKAAYKVRYKDDGKRHYYETDSLETSRAESKRHDRRWEEVPPWADGSIGAVFGLLFRNSAIVDGLELYAAYDQLSDILEYFSETSYSFPGHYRKEFQVFGQYWPAQSAFNALSSLVTAHQKREFSDRCMESYHANIQNIQAKMSAQSA